MSLVVSEVYDALIDAGVDKIKAEKAAKTVISRQEAEGLANKADLNVLRADLYRAMMIQSLAIVGAIVAILQLLG